jgi:hypothetical protein
MQSLVVVPVHPAEGGKFGVVDGAPRPRPRGSADEGVDALSVKTSRAQPLGVVLAGSVVTRDGLGRSRASVPRQKFTR